MEPIVDTGQQNQPENEAGQQTTHTHDYPIPVPGQEPAASEAGVEQQTVPKERFDEVNNEVAALKEKVELMEQNSALAAANAPQQTAEQAKPFDIFEHAEVGQDDDTISVGQAKKIVEYTTKTQQAQIDDLRFHVERPDYYDVVGTPDKVKLGQFAAPLAAVFKETPTLLTTMLSSRNPKKAAYELGKAAAANQATAPKAESKDDAQKAIDEAVANAERVKSSATVRGGSPLSEEGRYMNLDNAAFVELARSHGANV